MSLNRTVTRLHGFLVADLGFAVAKPLLCNNLVDHVAEVLLQSAQLSQQQRSGSGNNTEMGQHEPSSHHYLHPRSDPS